MAKNTLYKIPKEINPSGYVCFTVRVPDNEDYRAHFIGAIFNLTRWYSFERDELKQGKDVAQVWNGVFNDMMSRIGDCSVLDEMKFRQTGCTLEMSTDGVSWSPIFEITEACVATKVTNLVNSGGLRLSPPFAPSNSGSITPEMIQETISNDLDAVWGACLEASEYVFEVLSAFLSMLEAVGNATDALSKMLETPVEQLTEWVADNPVGTQKTFQSYGGGSKWDTDTYTQTYERSITNPVKGISPAKILGYFQSALDLGIAIIRAGLTETYQEYVASILFNALTCLPDGTRKTTGIVLNDDFIAEWGQKLLDGNLQDKIVGGAIFAEQLVAGLPFASLLDFGDLFRQFRLGSLSPSNTWTIIVEPCEDETEPIAFSVVYDFSIRSYAEKIFMSTISAGMTAQAQAGTYSALGYWHNQVFRYLTQFWRTVVMRTVAHPSMFVTTVTIDYEVIAGTGGSWGSPYVAWSPSNNNNATGRVSQAIPQNSHVGSVTLEINRTCTIQSISVWGYRRTNGTVPNGDARLLKVTINSDSPIPVVLIPE